MQTQESRDQKAVVIATGLGLFCLVLALGGLAAWGADLLLELSDPTKSALRWALLISAGATLVAHLVRAGRR